MPEVRIIRNYVGFENSHTLDSYLERGGYEALRKSLETAPDEITEIIKKSGLRGRVDLPGFVHRHNGYPGLQHRIVAVLPINFFCKLVQVNLLAATAPEDVPVPVTGLN